MKKSLIVLASLLLLSSCAAPRMYYWGDNKSGVSMYEHLTYNSYDTQTPESICDLVVLYEDMINNPGGTRNVVPPGIYAEYGYILLQERTVDSFEKYATSRQKRVFDTEDYFSLFHEKGIKMLEKEIELYPESEKFIRPLLNRMKGS